MTESPAAFRGLSLSPFRATRYVHRDAELGLALSPPYDVITPADRQALVAASPTNVVRLILPEQDEAALAGGDRYQGADALLDSWLADADAGGGRGRGAVRLRDGQPGRLR